MASVVRRAVATINSAAATRAAATVNCAAAPRSAASATPLTMKRFYSSDAREVKAMESEFHRVEAEARAAEILRLEASFLSHSKETYESLAQQEKAFVAHCKETHEALLKQGRESLAHSKATIDSLSKLEREFLAFSKSTNVELSKLGKEVTALNKKLLDYRLEEAARHGETWKMQIWTIMEMGRTTWKLCMSVLAVTGTVGFGVAQVLNSNREEENLRASRELMQLQKEELMAFMESAATAVVCKELTKHTISDDGEGEKCQA